MTKTEILQELLKLTSEERNEIRLKLAELDEGRWLDEDDPLTEAEKALLEARLAAYEKDPDAGSSWEEMESRIREVPLAYLRLRKHTHVRRILVRRFPYRVFNIVRADAIIS